MVTSEQAASLEHQIDRWRSYLQRRQAIEPVDVAELEDHLREQITGLADAGLDSDEAFLVAVKRMGSLDNLSREFAQERADRLWKQLVLPRSEPGKQGSAARSEGVVVFCLALAAALVLKVPALFGIQGDDGFYARNLGLLVLPFLTGYFVWKRGLSSRTTLKLAAAFAGAALVVNAFPTSSGGYSEGLTALHLPIALWLLVGIAYAGGRWRQVSARMNFVRFSGELFIYYVLIALGGGVLAAFMALVFQAIGIDVEPFFEAWLLPCGAAGAVLVASWLVEAKQSVIENMAPVLTRLFTPLFAAVLVTFLGTLLWTGRVVDIDRDVLIAFDLLLVVVLGLLLYYVSARDPLSPPGAFDVLQVVLVLSALAVDAFALWAIASRIGEFGFTANRVAALGENVILLVNLAWSAVLYLRFLRGRGPFSDLERWQVNYLPVYAVWAAIVVAIFPPLFGYN